MHRRASRCLGVHAAALASCLFCLAAPAEAALDAGASWPATLRWPTAPADHAELVVVVDANGSLHGSVRWTLATCDPIEIQAPAEPARLVLDGAPSDGRFELAIGRRHATPTRDSNTSRCTVGARWTGDGLRPATGELWMPADQVAWLPRLDRRMTWDVTVELPEDRELLASGHDLPISPLDADRAAAAAAAGRRLERRRLETPARAFGLAIGRLRAINLAPGGRLVVARGGPNIGRRELDRLARRIDRLLATNVRQFGPAPFGEPTVILGGVGRSRSLPGWIWLGGSVSGDAGTPGFEQSAIRAVAHELAHQWWGHAVGWTRPEHRWWSEAVAEWLALRQTLADSPDARRRDAQRRLALLLEAPTRRQSVDPIYALGPFLLDALALRLGEAFLVERLSRLARAAPIDLTVDAVMSHLTAAGGPEVDDLVERIIERVEAPILAYRLEPSRSDQPRRLVIDRLDVATVPRVVDLGSGQLDVVRVPVDAPDPSLRIEIPVTFATDPSTGATGAEHTTQTGERIIVFAGERLDLEIQDDVARVEVDPRGQVFAQWLDASRDTGEIALRRAWMALAHGAFRDVHTALRRAREAGPPSELSRRERRLAGAELEARASILEARALLRQATPRLTDREAGKTFRALDAALQAATRLEDRRAIDREVTILNARLAYRLGDIERARGTLPELGNDAEARLLRALIVGPESGRRGDRPQEAP
ncbi:MAG: hypothetical protein AAGN46_10865 [Acidobacteriota bacterium]